MFKNVYNHYYWKPPRYHGSEQMESERTLNDAFSFNNCIDITNKNVYRVEQI